MDREYFFCHFVLIPRIIVFYCEKKRKFYKAKYLIEECEREKNKEMEFLITITNCCSIRTSFFWIMRK